MNISTAAIYLERGYRIRRASWEPEEYIDECADMLDKTEVVYSSIFNTKTKKFTENRSVSKSGPIGIGLKDLLADDWEIVTSGIRKEFNKYGNFEYNDEPDWDNYEPDYGSWGGEEDEG